MPDKNIRLICLLFTLLLFDAAATGLASPEIAAFFTNSASSHHNVIFGTGFIILLSPIYIIAAPILGHWSDQIGRKKLLVFCYGVAVISFTLSWVGQSINNLTIAYSGSLLYGLASTCLPLVMALICDITDSSQLQTQRVRFFTLVLISMAFIIFADYLGNELTRYWTHQHLGLKIASLLEAANFILALCFLPNLFKAKPYGENQIQFHGFAQCFVRILMVRKVRSYLACLIGFSFVWGLYTQSMYTVLRYFLHFSPTIATQYQLYCFAILALTAAITALTPLAKTVALYSDGVIKISTLVVGVCLLCIMLVSLQPIAFWLIALPINICFSLGMTSLWFKLSKSGSNRYYGVLMGIQGVSWAFVWAMSGIVSNSINQFINTEGVLNYYWIGMIAVLALVSISRRRH